MNLDPGAWIGIEAEHRNGVVFDCKGSNQGRHHKFLGQFLAGPVPCWSMGTGDSADVGCPKIEWARGQWTWSKLGRWLASYCTFRGQVPACLPTNILPLTYLHTHILLLIFPPTYLYTSSEPVDLDLVNAEWVRLAPCCTMVYNAALWCTMLHNGQCIFWGQMVPSEMHLSRNTSQPKHIHISDSRRTKLSIYALGQEP